MDFDSQLKHFSKRIEHLSKELKVMKEFGLNEDLLLAYLCHNLKISEKKAKQIMDCYEDFYGEFLKTGIANSIEKPK
jgi:hypothetical protein